MKSEKIVRAHFNIPFFEEAYLSLSLFKRDEIAPATLSVIRQNIYMGLKTSHYTKNNYFS